MKKKLIIFLLLIVIVSTSSYITYSYIRSNTKISITSEPTKFICEYDVKTNPLKSKYGYSEILVTVKNYKIIDKNGKEETVLSEVPFKYDINVYNSEYKDLDNTIENDVIGQFGYNHNFTSNLTIKDKIVSTSKTDKVHKIQIKTNSNISEQVNYKVKVDCIQLNEVSGDNNE